MSVETILYQLLLEHECVILPNFGGFIVRESPCNYNTAKAIIKPYSKSIFFNQHLIENDGLLINAIARLKNKSYLEATNEVETWIQKLTQQIETEGSLSISNIGLFTKGSEGNKWFAADSSLNLSLQTYGLRPVKAELIHSSVPETEAPVYEIKPLADNKPIETFTIKRTNWKAWVAAASIAIVAHIGYLTIESFQARKTDHQASVVPMPDSVQPTPQEIITPIAEDTTIIDAPIVEPSTEVETIETPEATVAAPVETIVPEAVIPIIAPAPSLELSTDSLVGRYKLEINAINHLKDLSKVGITANIQQSANGLYEVKVPRNN